VFATLKLKTTQRVTFSYSVVNLLKPALARGFRLRSGSSASVSAELDKGNPYHWPNRLPPLRWRTAYWAKAAIISSGLLRNSSV
jgi:hypothetical protein